MTNEEPTTTEPTPADATPEQEAHSEANNPRLAKVSEEAKRYRLRVRELEKQVEALTGERDASTASVKELREQAPVSDLSTMRTRIPASQRIP